MTPVWVRKRTSGKTQKILLPPVEDDCDLKKLPSGFTSAYFFSVGSARKRPSVELVVELDRGQSLRLFVAGSPTTPLDTSRDDKHTLRAILSVVRPVYSRLSDTPHSTDDPSDTIIYRRTIAYASNTNIHKSAYRPLSVISCNLLRLDPFLYYSPVITAVLGFPLGGSLLRLRRNTAYLPTSSPGPV